MKSRHVSLAFVLTLSVLFSSCMLEPVEENPSPETALSVKSADSETTPLILYALDASPEDPQQNVPEIPVTPEPEPEPVSTPDPEPTWAPEPEPTWTPEPEQTWTPEPEQTWTPEPEQTWTPEPEQTWTPEPEQTWTPDPEPTWTPEPEPTWTPEPESPIDRTYPGDPYWLGFTYEHETVEQYVLNTNTQKIHKASCKDAARIKPENYSPTSSPWDYFAFGYVNCKNCGGCG